MSSLHAAAELAGADARVIKFAFGAQAQITAGALSGPSLPAVTAGADR